jgi:hypothetical protein
VHSTLKIFVSQAKDDTIQITQKGGQKLQK